MNSEAVANYLAELAANERKNNYCRQIVVSNPNFVPLQLFKKYAKPQKTQLDRNSFYQMISDFEGSYNSQQKMQIFGYFQIDNKQYVNFDQFYAGIVPLSNPSLKKIMQSRKNDNFELDFSLNFAINKYFARIYQNQLDLENKINFEIQPIECSDKLKTKEKISLQFIERFMNLHEKYPTKAVIELVHNDLNKNKGLKDRNILIRYYIKRYLNEIKLNKGDLPKLIPKSSNESTNLNKDCLKQKPNNPIKKQVCKIYKTSVKASKSIFTIQQSNLSEVEGKIRTILNTVSIKPTSLVIKKQNSQKNQETRQKLTQNINKTKINALITSIFQSNRRDVASSAPICVKCHGVIPLPTQRDVIRKNIDQQSKQSSQRRYKSVNKDQNWQNIVQQSNTTPRKPQRQLSQQKNLKQGNREEDELSYRYRRFNYLKQDNWQAAKRMKYPNSFLESPLKSNTKATRRR